MSTFESTAFQRADETVKFMGKVLEASTEYSMIGTDLEGKILLWNEGARRIYGYTASEVIGRPTSILHTEAGIASGLPDEMMEVALDQDKWEGTVQRVRKDGESFTARVVVTPRRDSEGAPDGFLMISSDIADEVRLRRELKETQLYTRSLIESNIDALITTDPIGVISDVNHQMEALTGYSRKELIGTPFKNFFTDPDRAEEGIRLTLSEGKVTNYELTARARGGTETVVSYNASTFTDPDGELQGVFAAARDVTEHKLFEDELQRTNVKLEAANLSKDRFLAGMSHELRTPLNAILGFTGTLLMELPGPLNDEQKGQLQIVGRNSRHLLSIINDLLDLARIESESVELQIEEVGCRSLLEEVTSGLRPLAEEKQLGLEVAMPGPEVTLSNDRRSLSQILINLIGNAIKFTDRGEVRIEFDQRSDNGSSVTHFNVVDTGVGVRLEDQQNLFAAFEQAGTSATRRREGTGLGLYISQRLASLIGGTISCESEYGKGSTFALELRE